MFLLHCKNCHDVFVPIRDEVKYCNCAISSATIINNQLEYTGEFATPLYITESTLLKYVCGRAVRVKGNVKSKLTEAHRDFFTEVMEYLNMVSSQAFPIKFPSEFSKCILERKREYPKLTIFDFKALIDSKVNQWKGTPMEINLRPSTLFNRTKFANYIGQVHATTTPTPASTFEKFSQTVNAAKGNINTRT